MHEQVGRRMQDNPYLQPDYRQP